MKRYGLTDADIMKIFVDAMQQMAADGHEERMITRIRDGRFERLGQDMYGFIREQMENMEPVEETESVKEIYTGEKVLLSVDEAVEYFNVSKDAIMEIILKDDSLFVNVKGIMMIKRVRFEAYLLAAKDVGNIFSPSDTELDPWDTADFYDKYLRDEDSSDISWVDRKS